MVDAKFAWLGSLILMAGALFFQYGLDMRPCQLCIYQRVAHIAALIIGGAAIGFKKPGLGYLAALCVFAGAGIAFYHVGVEQHWWEGLKSCTGDLQMNLDELLATPPARCDEIPWSLFGLSMAAWNGIISLVLGGLWLLGARKMRA